MKRTKNRPRANGGSRNRVGRKRVTRTRNAQTELKVEYVPIFSIDPSPENGLIYGPVVEDDPSIIKLAESIKKNGVLVPLTITSDEWPNILYGHRRHKAAMMVGLDEVPVIRHPIVRGDVDRASNDYIRLLVADNAPQRIKTRDEALREIIASSDSKQTYERLKAKRARKRKLKVEAIVLDEGKPRAEISAAKKPMLAACRNIVEELTEFHPLTVRQIHYQLLNEPPLIHASKPHSRYRNDKKSYAALSELLTRARLEGYIDFDAIDDPTRHTLLWPHWANLAAYIDEFLENGLTDYRRELMRSQPHHLEIVFEKNTVENIVADLAYIYDIPAPSSRGQGSTPMIYKIARRYAASGKDKLIVIALADLDPAGDIIMQSIGKRLRDDHHIPAQNIEIIKCAFTMKQVKQLNIPESPFQRAKRGKPGSAQETIYLKYVEKYGNDAVWELEAAPPEWLQRQLRDTIENVIHRAAYNHDVREEEMDSAKLDALRKLLLDVFATHARLILNE